MHRSIVIALVLVFSACGSADAPESSPAQNVSSGDRQSLTGHQLGALLPARVGAFALNQGMAQFYDARVDGIYRDGDRQVNVSLDDLADTPEYLPRHQTRLQSEALEVKSVGSPRPTRYTSVEADSEGDALVWRAVGEYGDVNLHALVANRFLVQLSGSGDVTLDALGAFWEASGFGALGSTPFYAEAGPDESPSWVTGATGEETEEPAASEGPAVTVADGPTLATLPACDALLPISAVEQACGVSGVRTVATDFEETGENCNRAYKRGEGPSSGLIFLVSKFADVATAGRALGVSVDVDNREDLRSLDGLGGLSYRHYDNHVAKFAKGNVLVELKASDSPFDQPAQKLCLDSDDLAALAEGVAARLSD